MRSLYHGVAENCINREVTSYPNPGDQVAALARALQKTLSVADFPAPRTRSAVDKERHLSHTRLKVINRSV